jgi:tryptophan-rich sensory protein
MNKFSRVAIVVVICLVVGYVSGMVTRTSITTWYPTLVKPSFNPPNWIFAPVWTSLYVMMGVAAGFIWNQITTQKVAVTKALQIFAIQLVLNALWSYLFFGLHNLIETYSQFAKINKTASYLMLPYLAWVSFASVLTASIWWLNR